MTVRPNTRKKSARSSGGLLFKRFAFRRQASLCDEQARFRSAAVLEGIDAGKALKAVIDAGDSEKLTAASYTALQTGGAWSVERLRDLQDGDFLLCNESEMVLVRKVLSPDATDVFYSSPETGVCQRPHALVQNGKRDVARI